MGFLKAKIKLENRFKITVFLDTDAKINIMIKKIIENVGLAMQYNIKLELVSYTNNIHLFFGLCEDVKVAIKGFKTRYPIFVIKIEDHNLNLRQHFF